MNVTRSVRPMFVSAATRAVTVALRHLLHSHSMYLDGTCPSARARLSKLAVRVALNPVESTTLLQHARLGIPSKLSTVYPQLFLF